jgi:hypothetical protein
MEKTWERFWQTGKVTDYLAYCGTGTAGTQMEQKEQKTYGTAGGIDRDGLKCHAGGRL